MVSARLRRPTDPTGDPSRDRATDPSNTRVDDKPRLHSAYAGSPPPPEHVGGAQIASGLNVVAGLWLILAPTALGYRGIASDATWNDSIIGASIAVLALIRVGRPRATAELSWVNFVLGVWLMVAPFVLDYGQDPNALAATSNDIALGLIVLTLAGWSAIIGRRNRHAETQPHDAHFER